MKTYKEDIISMFKDAQSLIFYKAMQYPVPQNYHKFMTKKSSKKRGNNTTTRQYQNPYQKEYTEYIQKKSKILQNLPFVKEIYICNSMSFNALKEGSDIDLFIVTHKNALRRARFFSVLILRITNSLRKRSVRKKFCLSFYTTENNRNLYHISLDKVDIYLHYRITHLIPLYTDPEQRRTIREENERTQSLLPNSTTKKNINYKIQIQTSKKTIKKIIEKIFTGPFGKLSEWILKSVRSPIVIRKKRRLGLKGMGIVIHPKMLKFYEDKREKYRLLYQVEKKHQQKI